MENIENMENKQDVQPQQKPGIRYTLESRTSSHLPVANGEPESVVTQDLFTLLQFCKGLWTKVQYSQTQVNLELKEAIKQFADLIKLQSDFLFSTKDYTTNVKIGHTDLGYLFEVVLKKGDIEKSDKIAILDYPLGEVIPVNKAAKVVWSLDRWFDKGVVTELNLLRNNDKILHVLHEWRNASLRNEQLYTILLNLTYKRNLTGINIVTTEQVTTTDLIVRFIEKLSEMH